MGDFCLCNSRKTYDKCCGRFLSEGNNAKTPEQLMRSRYTAYALGGHGNYLLKTWLPVMAKGLNEVELSQKNIEWIGLSIISKSQKGDDGYVEFRATFLDKQNNEADHHEKSVFKRISGQWFYVGEEMSS